MIGPPICEVTRALDSSTMHPSVSSLVPNVDAAAGFSPPCLRYSVAIGDF